MNKKGQILVTFVLLIPLLLIISAFIVDNSLIAYKHKELNNITKEIIRKDFNNKNYTKDDIKNIYIKNSIYLSYIDIKNTDDYSISAKYQVNSIFGKIIGIDDYNIEVNLKGYKKDNKIVFENR